MYIINWIRSLCNDSARRLRTACVDTEHESTALVEQDERTGGFYSAMADSNNAAGDRKSFSMGFQTFEESGAALRLCGILVLLYIAIGIIAFSFVFEEWSLASSAYFSVVTFTTLGYGDLSPSTQAGRLFTVFFTLYGVTIIGVFLGIIGAGVVEAQTTTLEAVREQSRKNVLGMFSAKSTDNALTDEGGGQTEPKEITVWDEILEIVKLEGPLLAIIVVSTVLIGGHEGFTLIDSIYFCTITLTTVGFGDMHPKDDGMRVLFVFYLPVAVAVFGEMLGRIASAYMKRKARKAEKLFLARELTVDDLKAMDRNADAKVTRGEFMSFMLVAMQKVDQDTIDELRSLFDSLDADGSGELDKNDLILKANQKKASQGQSGAVI